jgi:hypothetical protein
MRACLAGEAEERLSVSAAPGPSPPPGVEGHGPSAPPVMEGQGDADSLLPYYRGCLLGLVRAECVDNLLPTTRSTAGIFALSRPDQSLRWSKEHPASSGTI